MVFRKEEKESVLAKTVAITKPSLSRKAALISLTIVFFLLGNAIACSISTDKQNYCIGEMVSFNYYVNQECNVNIKMISPSGQSIIHSERASAGNHQFQGQAWSPIGTRTVILEANGAECARTSYNIINCNPVCDQNACNSRSGPAGQVTENGVTYQVTNVCTCVNNNCQCIPSKTPITPTCNQAACQSRGGPAGQITENGVTYQLTNFCNCINNKCECVQGRKSICDQVACNSRGGYAGQVVENGVTYQVTNLCNCVNDNCQCEQVKTPVTPACDQIACQSQNKVLGPAFKRDGFWYEPFLDCQCTISGNCECNEIERLTAEPPKPICSGTISGKVKDAKTGSLLPGAVQLICDNVGECLGAPGPSDSSGSYRLVGRCPSTSYEITCSAEGYKESTLEVITDKNGNAQQDFSLEPDCQGTISGRVSDVKNNNQPIRDANLLICQNGKCMDPVVTDSKGQYSLKGFCPSSNFDITCSAEGFRNQEKTGTTDSEGNSKNQDILMESESTLKDIRFEGTFYRGNAPMGFTVYYFKVDKIIEGEAIPIGDPIGVSVYDSSVLPGQGGSADTLQDGDRAEVYARIYVDKGKHDDGYETAWSASITEDGKYYVRKASSGTSGCSGAILVEVYDAKTEAPIKEPNLQITQPKYLLVNPTIVPGHFSADGSCPLALTTLTCKAENYMPSAKLITTDSKGDGQAIFKLEPKIRAMWVSEVNPNYSDLINFAKSNKINLIFQSVSAATDDTLLQYDSLINLAHQNNIQIHAMILADARCALKENRIASLEVVKKVLKYKFDGIHLDTEPHQQVKENGVVVYEGWDGADVEFIQDTWKDFVSLINDVYSVTHGKTTFSASIPPWYFVNAKSKKLKLAGVNVKDLYGKADILVLMAYGDENAEEKYYDTPEKIKNSISNIMDDNSENKPSIIIGIGAYEFNNINNIEDCMIKLNDIYSGNRKFSGFSIFDYKSYKELN